MVTIDQSLHAYKTLENLVNGIEPLSRMKVMAGVFEPFGLDQK
jgi:hypothetical protein